MEHLFCFYEIAMHYEIVSYKTNIYLLHQQMFASGDTNPDELDFLQTLKEHEKDEKKRAIFDDIYSDIFLIFDFEPQDPRFTPERIKQMLLHFNESTDHGKLYINYPMAEAFYHMHTIPDPDYRNRMASLHEISSYKDMVFDKTAKHHYRRKFAQTAGDCRYVIEENCRKAWDLVKRPESIKQFPAFSDILDAQLHSLTTLGQIAVLCTCVAFILENPVNPTKLREV